MAQTEEFMFSNVAYRVTVYRTGTIYVCFFNFFKQTLIAKLVRKQLTRGIRDRHGKNVLKTKTATSL